MIDMFRKIEFNQLKLANQFHDYEPIYTKSELSEMELAKIVSKNVCLQAALADFFSLKLDNLSTAFCFKEPSKKDAEIILSALSQMFKSAMAANFSDCYYSVQLHGAKPIVYTIMSLLYAERSINPFITHFSEKTGFANDVRQTIFFELDKEHIDFKKVKDISEEYHKFLHDCFKYECNYSISASGFSMDELCSDPYLHSIAKYAKHLYLLVFPIDINGKTEFVKSIKLSV